MGLFGKRSTNEGKAAKSPVKGFFLGMMGGSSAKEKPISQEKLVRQAEPASPVQPQLLPKRQLLPVEPQPVSPPKETEQTVVAILAETYTPVDIDGLALAINLLSGIRGDGLLGAAMQSSALAQSLTVLVEEVLRLENDASVAYGHRQNVRTISAFYQEVVYMLDANGSRLSAATVPAVRRITSYAREVSDLVAACSQPGWLVRMARGEGVRDEFARVHDAALSVMRVEGLDLGPSSRDGKPARRLASGDYADLSKRMKKLLKQVGEGAVEGGVRRLRTDEGARREVAAAADVPPDAVLRDAQLDLDVTSGAAIVADGPERDTECDKVFRAYVTHSSAHISADGLLEVMGDMGLLDGVDPYDRPAAARSALVAADLDYDGALSFPEFRAFYTRHPTTAARLMLRLTTGLRVERQLQETFNRFAAFGKRQGALLSPRGAADSPALDCPRFSKVCKDCGLLGGGLTPQYVDIVYSKCKPRDALRMTFDHFVAALALAAERKGQPLGRVVSAVVASAGPALRATKAVYVKLHDDKSQFTGVYARGGPSTTDATVLDPGAMVKNRTKEPRRPAPPTGAPPPKLDTTKPESPVLSTRHRVAKPGPVTPGRGASTAATAARAAARAEAAASPPPPVPSSAFGRCSTPRASPVKATARTAKGPTAKTSPAKTSVAATAAAEVSPYSPQHATPLPAPAPCPDEPPAVSAAHGPTPSQSSSALSSPTPSVSAGANGMGERSGDLSEHFAQSTVVDDGGSESPKLLPVDDSAWTSPSAADGGDGLPPAFGATASRIDETEGETEEDGSTLGAVITKGEPLPAGAQSPPAGLPAPGARSAAILPEGPPSGILRDEEVVDEGDPEVGSEPGVFEEEEAPVVCASGGHTERKVPQPASEAGDQIAVKAHAAAA